MKNPKIHILLCILIFLAFLSACSGFGADKAKPALLLEPCTVGPYQAQCGTLRVYENRIAKKGRKINIQVAVIKATSPNPATDPIFYLAGGPGESAIEDAQRQQFSVSLSTTRDLVFVDQRGTGNSNPETISQGYPDFIGSTAEQIDAETKARAWEYKVLSLVKINPRFYTTSMAMDDLDEVREALEYDKINLVGYSYGATAAQYYLRQHEEHVRTVTLGVGSLLDIPVFELWAKNSQRALNLLFEDCINDSVCYAAFPNLQAEFTDLFSRLETNPVTDTFNNPSNLQPASVTYTPDFFAAVVRHMTKDTKNGYALPNLIHRAYFANDWKGFTQFYADSGGPEWWGNLVMEHIIRCSEKWASFDPAVVAESSKGSYIAGWDISLAKHQAFSCKYTPRGATLEGTTPQQGSNVPVLILNGEMDPIDPPENMSGSKALWPNSLSLVEPFQAHNISNIDEIICWWSIQDEFINNASVTNLDTSCMQKIKPPAFDRTSDD
jgi:pimeloyl-ACP methyl ester carboxylesterase